MSDPDPEAEIKRILVAIDASPDSLAALEAAAEMAARLEAELLGLFVEDINLIRLGELPIAREIGYPSAIRRESGELGIERSLRAVAARAREALASTAERMKLRWSFRVERGPVTSVLLEAAPAADLIVVGRISRSTGSRARLGSTARALVTQTPSSLFVIHPRSPSNHPVLVVYDGSPASRRALEFAAHLEQPARDGLIVLVLADEPQAVQRLEREAGERLKEHGVVPAYRRMARVSASDLVRMAKRDRAGALVLSGVNRLAEGPKVAELVDQLDCTVFLVR